VNELGSIGEIFENFDGKAWLVDQSNRKYLIGKIRQIPSNPITRTLPSSITLNYRKIQ
jgi:hypothetical protein